MYGGAGLQEIDNLIEWLEHVQKASSYLCIRQSDQNMVGICNIRHKLNQERLLNVTGHIGYSIRPSERQKAYDWGVLV